MFLARFFDTVTGLLQPMHRGWHVSVLAMLAVLAGPAAGEGVVVLLSENSQPYLEVAEAFKGTLDKNALPRISVLQVTLQPSAGRGEYPMLKDADLVVTVGMQATQRAAEESLSVPVLATLVPRLAFDRLLSLRQRDMRTFSAIYLDQPAARQLALLRVALPGRKRLGVVVGPESQDKLKLLQATLRDTKLQLVVESIDSADELIPALQRVLAESDALLALPDPLVFNKNNVQSILLTAYHYQDPVIGYSNAYVKAGALAAVYSRPEQIGQQAAEVVQRLLAAKAAGLPSGQYPKYFNVSVNYQVARSLGIRIEEEQVLADMIKRAMEQEQ